MSGSTTEEASQRVRYGSGRRALLDAAIAVVARGGLRRLTYREVARQAGVSHTLVSHHFGSLHALLAEALTHSIQRSITDTGLISGARGIDGFMSDLPEAVDQDPDLQAFQLQVTLEARRDTELAPLAAGLYERYRDATREGLSGLGIRDEAVVAATLAALDGLILHQVTVGTSRNTQLGLDGLRQMLKLYLSATSKAASGQAAD